MGYLIRSLKTIVLSFKVQVLLVLIEISMTTQLRLNCNTTHQRYVIFKLISKLLLKEYLIRSSKTFVLSFQVQVWLVPIEISMTWLHVRV